MRTLKPPKLHYISMNSSFLLLISVNLFYLCSFVAKFYWRNLCTFFHHCFAFRRYVGFSNWCIFVFSWGAFSRVNCLKSSCLTKYPGVVGASVHAVTTSVFVSRVDCWKGSFRGRDASVQWILPSQESWICWPKFLNLAVTDTQLISSSSALATFLPWCHRRFSSAHLLQLNIISNAHRLFLNFLTIPCCLLQEKAPIKKIHFTLHTNWLL